MSLVVSILEDMACGGSLEGCQDKEGDILCDDEVKQCLGTDIAYPSCATLRPQVFL